ncbi:MAG: hypothetical protein JO013_00685 [Alphaproteobacteria bacterium]|nr:hypothetical protein [Alphaproteobacteria bacterium]
MSYDYDASYLDAADAEAWPGENESESYDSYDAEARGKRRGPPPLRRPSARAPFRPRPGGAAAGVTQAQLAEAIKGVRTETTGLIKQVDSSVRVAVKDMQRLQSETKKSVEKVKGDVRTLALVSAITPLVAPPGSALAPLASFFPLIATDVLSGPSGSSGTSGQSGSGFLTNQNTLLLAAVVASSAGLFDKK